MPLPTNDPVAFRGVPSLGGNKKMALTMTFTQKQVEAMFQRHDALRAQGSSQCPLEIDFDENKIYIGNIATPFTRVKEDGTREICQRSPTVSKPLAGITLAGNVIGKLNIQRDYDQDVADTIRKVTEAEVSKRKERNIVRLDSPPVLANGKKSKPGSGTSLAKRAMTNRIVSTQAASSRGSTSASPSSRPTAQIPSSVNNRPTPRNSSVRSSTSNSTLQPTASSSTSAELDLTSLRSHMIHYLALDPRTTEDVLLKIGGNSPTAETVREIEEILTTVAEEVPRPKNAAQCPVKWQLRIRSWDEVRPYEYGPLSDTDRKKMARRGRITLGPVVDSCSPLWEHLRADVDVGATSSSVKGKGKTKPTVNLPLVKTSDFKGGMYPKEKKPGVKGASVASGGVTKTKATATKSKAKKEEDEVEAKARKVIASLDDPKGKGKGVLSALTDSTGTGKTRSKEETERTIPLGAKSRQSLLSSKKSDSTPPSSSRRVQDDKRKLAELDVEDGEEMEEGELPAKPAAKKRKINSDVNISKPKTTENDTPAPKGNKEKGKDFAKDESASLKPAKSGIVASRASAGGSSGKTAASGSIALKLEKEKEREASELERLKDRGREKRHASGKRGRRVTPSFSSDEDEETEVKTAPPSRATKQKAPTQPTTSSKLATPASKPARAPSPALPTDKEGLRRRYRMCYARYMGVTSKFHEQIAKIEEALSADNDSMSGEDDSDMMDTEQLMQLRGEHERLRDELERIQRAHAMVF